MCTAVSLGGYFGRTLDLEYSYNETVTVTPRGFRFGFDEKQEPIAVIGMATVADGYPLYYDAVNERGLCMAGLNFPKSAKYFPNAAGKTNLASFELIPFLLRQCGSVAEAKRLLADVNICDRSFSDIFSATPLHWMIADRERAICAESCADGLHVYEDSVGVLTNEPPFPAQAENLARFSHLTSDEPADCEPDSRGTGALGLPGDFSSPSRFVRAAFLRKNSLSSDGELDGIGRLFRILGSVEVPRGCVRLSDGKNVITHYTSCMDMRRGIYYYKTYGNSRISAVDMHREELRGNRLISYPLNKEQDIFMQN